MIMHKMLEKLRNAVLIGGGLGLILPFIIYTCAAFSKLIPVCSQLLLFHFFNTSVFIIIVVETENSSVSLNWPISFLTK